MQVLITGASGLLGRAAVRALEAQGHGVRRLGRRHGTGGDESRAATWEPLQGRLEPHVFAGIDAVVHLAGESLAGVWTAKKKRAIRDSRVLGTSLLCTCMAGLSQPPAVLVSASAIGYYGDRADALLTEESESGTGFLAQMCLEWEGATEPARQAGVRVVHPRFGIVLSQAGGMLPRLLPLFRLGLGARLGTGQQFMSWISLDDAVAVILALLEDLQNHRVFDGSGLQTEQTGDDLQIVLDPVMNFLQEYNLLPEGSFDLFLRTHALGNLLHWHTLPELLMKLRVAIALEHALVLTVLRERIGQALGRIMRSVREQQAA